VVNRVITQLSEGELNLIRVLAKHIQLSSLDWRASPKGWVKLDAELEEIMDLADRGLIYQLFMKLHSGA